MSKQIATPQEIAQKWGFLTKLGAFIGIGLIAAPVVGIALYGLLGIIAAFVIGTAGIVLAPYLGQKAENWKLKLLKAEAAQNPIETLQNILLDKTNAAAAKKQAIDQFRAIVISLEQKVNAYKKKYGVPSPQIDRLATMQTALKTSEDNYVEIKKNLIFFEEEINKAKDDWEISLALAEANKCAGTAEEDFYNRIKETTAIDSIQENLNLAFSSLDSNLLDDRAENEMLPAKRINLIQES